jgi:DNA-binding MarR family transcriptional regulator
MTMIGADPNRQTYARIAALRCAISSFSHESNEICASLGLTPRHYEILVAAASSRTSTGPTLGRVAADLGLAPSTTVGVVNDLESRGLIARVRDPWDRRVVRLEPTEDGRRVIVELTELHEASRRRLIGRVLESVRDGEARLRAAASVRA